MNVRKMASERENSHFRWPHSDLSPTNSDESPETKDRGATSLPVTVCPSPSKNRVSTLNDTAQKTVFNAKWLFKVIQNHLFRCRWKAILGLHTKNNNLNQRWKWVVGHGSWVKWVTIFGWVTWVTGHGQWPIDPWWWNNCAVACNFFVLSWHYETVHSLN